MTRNRRRLMVSLVFSASAVALWRHIPAHAQSPADGARAFVPVASVLASPRCANCHISGDAPLQGHEGRAHTMNVRRGVDGRGTVAMHCTNCHQESTSAIPHAPPGGPDWRLPPAATPMAWRGLTPGDQCRMLTNRSTNGNRGVAELLEHVRTDGLVIASWSPGPGRLVPPISHEAFVQRFQEWIDAGARCPD